MPEIRISWEEAAPVRRVQGPFPTDGIQYVATKEELAEIDRQAELSYAKWMDQFRPAVTEWAFELVESCPLYLIPSVIATKILNNQRWRDSGPNLPSVSMMREFLERFLCQMG